MLPCHWGTWLLLPRLCILTVTDCTGRRATPWGTGAQGDNCRHGFIGRVFPWQLYIFRGFMSAQKKNLCMQQKGWMLVADCIVSVHPHTIQTTMKIEWCKAWFKGFSAFACNSSYQCYMGALLPESSCCGILPIYSDVTLCNFIIRWQKWHEAEALLLRKDASTSKNNS